MADIKISSDDLLSVAQAAKELGHPRITIYRWVEKGKIQSIRLGGTLYIPKSEVERIRESQ